MQALADLHRHLDGSLRDATLRELARPLGVEVPPLAALQFHTGMGLGGALQRFATTLAVLQQPAALRRVADECCQDARAEGVTTLELRFAPQLHGDIARAVDAVLEGLDGRAGLILCALYGEDPQILDELVRCGAARAGVVGVDLAAGPAPEHRFVMKDYAAGFARAADAGLGRTVHAGEGRPPEEIRTAIEVLGAQRIGHGTTLLQDPSVVELVRTRGVTIEACLTSNFNIGAISSVAEHPLARWLAQGISACVCADNTLFSATDAAREHTLARALPGMTDELFAKAVAAGHAAAFRR